MSEYQELTARLRMMAAPWDKASEAHGLTSLIGADLRAAADAIEHLTAERDNLLRVTQAQFTDRYKDLLEALDALDALDDDGSGGVTQ